MDQEAAKAREHAAWSKVAPGWRWHDARLRRYAAPVTERLVAGLEPGDFVLDVAAGTGEPSISAAQRVGPTGRVIATDFVEEMLAVARQKASQLGLQNLELRLIDAERIDAAAGSFDAITMRFGLMFMPDPAAFLEGARRALKPGGHIALAVWAGPDRNPWAAVPMAVLKRHMEIPAPLPGAPGIFAFADPARLRSALEGAGFEDVTIEEVKVTMSDFDTGVEFASFTLDVAGPIALLFDQLPQDKKALVTEEIGLAAERAGGGKPHLGGVALVATGRVSG